VNHKRILNRVKTLEQTFTPDEEPDPYSLYDSDFTEKELELLKRGWEIIHNLMEKGSRVVRMGPSTPLEKKAWMEHGFGSYPVLDVGYDLLTESEREIMNMATRLQIHRRNTKYNLGRRGIH
jgi:hypothetical protein